MFPLHPAPSFLQFNSSFLQSDAKTFRKYLKESFAVTIGELLSFVILLIPR